MNKKNFSLFELILVVVLVAAFAALMPAFANARAEAVEASCKNNQKQIMAAALAYANDYNKFMAPANHDSMNWNTYLHGYYRTGKTRKMGKKSYIPEKSKLLYCPDEPIIKDISYGVASAFKVKQAAWGVPIDQMNPDFLYLADINPNWLKISSTPSFMRRASVKGTTWGDIMLRHDNDTANVAKIDGSVVNLDEKTLKGDDKYWTVKK